MARQVASAADAANNWSAAMASPVTAQKFQQGVGRVNQSPMQAAASSDAQQRYAQNTQAAVTSGRMAAALNRVSLEQWKQATSSGASNLARGATSKKAKVQAAAQRLAPVWQQMSDAANALPKGGMANAMARVQAAIGVMMQATGKA